MITSPEKRTALGGKILLGGIKMDCSYKILNSYYTIDEDDDKQLTFF